MVRSAGGTTAAVGSSAWAPEDATEPTSAPALLLAADGDGRADIAETSARLLRRDAGAPLGITTDLDVLDGAYRRALDAEGPSLVVVDPGDPERARAATAAGSGWDEARSAAVRTTDAVVARIMRSLPADAALVVVSTADYRGGATPGFGPVIVYGAGPGTLTSASTHRAAIVTLPDAAATALALLGLDAPDGTTGVVLELTATSQGVAERLATVRGLDTRARAIAALREPVWFGFVAVCLVVLIAAYTALFAHSGRWVRAARAVLPWAIIGVLAIPPGSLVAVLFGAPISLRAAWIGLAAGSLAVLASALAWRRRDAISTFGRLMFITVFIVIADQVLGGRLADGTAFSYSPLFGVRFYGLGNEGAAVLFGALLAGIGWRVDRYGHDRARGFLVAGAIVVALAVLPAFGANVGVALWGTAALVAAYLWASGRRLTWRIVLLAAGAAIVVVGVAVGADLLGGGSHLGGFVEALGGGGAGIASMLSRKIELSLASVLATPLVVLLPVGLAGLAYQLARPTGRLGAALATHRGLAAVHAGVIAASCIAVFTEDSAVPIAAILMMYALAVLAVAALAERPDQEAS